MPTFADQVIQFTKNLKPDWNIPSDIELLFPYNHPDTMACLEAFYRKYYSDNNPRIFLFGINPGRLGAGITGVPFTDPIRLDEVCGIPNPFCKKAELSSIYIYDMIERMGGPDAFYSKYYITSLSPLGFTHQGKNYNYYDRKDLYQAVWPHMVDNIRLQKQFGTGSTAFSLGKGQNIKAFQVVEFAVLLNQ